jgi:hypothetical protein
MAPETKREFWFRFFFRLPPLEDRVRAQLAVAPVRPRRRGRGRLASRRQWFAIEERSGAALGVPSSMVAKPRYR